MSTHMKKSVDIAGKVVSMAEDTLAVLDRTISTWPSEFRAIIWDAVADIASRRAAAARIPQVSDNA